MSRLVAFLITSSVIGLSSVFPGRPQDEQEPDPKPTNFMAKKLDSARAIVSGLALENYDEINQAAQDLLILSHESDWNVIATESYLRMSSDFRGSVGRLQEAAQQKNVDSATVAFFEVTLNCVRCHKYVRGENKHRPGEGLRERIRDYTDEHKKHENSTPIK